MVCDHDLMLSMVAAAYCPEDEKGQERGYQNCRPISVRQPFTIFRLPAHLPLSSHLMPDADAEALSQLPEFDFMRALDIAIVFTPLALFADFPVEKQQTNSRRVTLHTLLEVRDFFNENDDEHVLTMRICYSRSATSNSQTALTELKPNSSAGRSLSMFP